MVSKMYDNSNSLGCKLCLSLLLTSVKMNFSLNFSWEIIFSHWREHILISHWQFLSDILAWNSVRKISKCFDIFLTEFLKIKGSDLRIVRILSAMCKKTYAKPKYKKKRYKEREKERERERKRERDVLWKMGKSNKCNI